MSSPSSRSPTAAVASGGPQQHSFRRFLKPTTQNFILWVPTIAVICILISIYMIHQRLLFYEKQITGSSTILSNIPRSLISRTSSISFENGFGRITPLPILSSKEHLHDLDQIDSTTQDANRDASNTPDNLNSNRPPLIRSHRSEILKKIFFGLHKNSNGDITTNDPLGQHRQHVMPDETQIVNIKSPIVTPPPPPPPPPTPASPVSSSAPIAPMPLLVFTFNRPENLRQTLNSLIANRPSIGHPIFISQDGSDTRVREVAMEYVNNVRKNPLWKDIHYLNHHWETSGVQVEPQHLQWTTYYKIATHYGWALRQVLDGGLTPGETSGGNGWKFDRIILIEDDMEVAPDFYSYFHRMSDIYDSDPTLLCVSAWNDNGRRPLVGHSNGIYRSECFPGLGWLLNRRIWNELRLKWPKGFWDDWLREPLQRQGRSCIFPEMNRVYTFGEKGASGGQFYDQYLKDIVLNRENIDWKQENLDYISTLENYRHWLWTKVSSSRFMSGVHELEQQTRDVSEGEFRIEYGHISQLDGILSQNITHTQTNKN